MEYLILIGALALIIVGAMLLTDGSVALAARFHVPEFIVGLTIVAVGTSMPELTVSMLAALGVHGDMAIGNIVGSNVFNVFAILGICAIFAPIMFTKKNEIKTFINDFNDLVLKAIKIMVDINIIFIEKLSVTEISSK